MSNQHTAEQVKAVRDGIEKLATANLELGLALGAAFGKSGLPAEQILQSLHKSGVAPTANILPVKATPPPAEKSSKTRNRPETGTEDVSQASKRTKKSSKKPKLLIKDRTKMPMIDLIKLDEIWPSLKEKLKDVKDKSKDGEGKTVQLLLEYEDGPEGEKKVDLKCAAIRIAIAFLKEHPTLLSKLTKARWDTAEKQFMLCCTMALIVEIERKRVWSTIKHNPADFVVSDSDIPEDMPRIEPHNIPAKETNELRIRTNKQTSLDLYKLIVRQNAQSAALLRTYEFKNESRILCFKWNSPVKRSASAKEPEFQRPASCNVVSEETKRFLTELLNAEEWQREMELLYHKLEQDKS